MNIYEAEGTDAIVDLRAAAAELKGSSSVTNDTTRRQIVAEIQTAALLDIALSLRVVAAEARAAMPDPHALTLLDSAEPEADAPRDFLIVGDLVLVDGNDEPAEVKAFGQSEGSITVDVLFANGAESRVWLDNVHRLTGDEGEAEEVAEASVAAIETEIADAAAPAEEAREDDADIDDDFGDEPTTALDTLKAAKKSKKGSKK